MKQTICDLCKEVIHDTHMKKTYTLNLDKSRKKWLSNEWSEYATREIDTHHVCVEKLFAATQSDDPLNMKGKT